MQLFMITTTKSMYYGSCKHPKLSEEKKKWSQNENECFWGEETLISDSIILWELFKTLNNLIK